MAYSLTYSYANANPAYYSVSGYSGITTSDNVVIPSTYDDGTNGEHPVKNIGSNAFYNCSSLTSVTIPDSVAFISWKAFSGCSGLTSITIPDSVTIIGDSTFYNCSSLMSVTIGNGVTSIGGWAFQNCKKLTSVTIPDSVTSIGKAAFNSCYGLTSITIPDGVTSIGEWAFYNCSRLTSVTIGNSVTSIGSSVFYNCTSLKQLILFPSTPPTLGSSAIPTTISKIYVQQSSKTAYQAATNWTTFASKIVSDNIYLSFVRFNQKNKEYIEKKINNLNASLAKADSSLQKPTAALAKESFVKVGIDGSQKFDENSYVIAPSTGGTAGQVLKKTANGTEWANESGGGGGGKLYLHYIIGSVNESSSFSFNVCLYTSSPEPINSNDKAFNVLNIGENQNRVIIGFFNGNKKYCCGVKFDKSLSAPAIRIEYLSETGNNISKEANINNDFVTEL